MADYVPKFDPGAAVTYVAESAVTGGRLVEVTGDRAVAHAAADSAAVVGVAARDAKAGESVAVHHVGRVHRLVASAAIDAGDSITSAANGKVAVFVADGEKASKNKLGVALTSAAEADDVIEALI